MSETNGQGELPYTLPDERKMNIQRGMLALQEIEQARDEYRGRWEVATTNLRALQAEHDALKLAYARMQTEMDAYRRDRDEAVTAKAEFTAVFDAVLTIMQKHRGDTRKDVAAILKDYEQDAAD